MCKRRIFTGLLAWLLASCGGGGGSAGTGSGGFATVASIAITATSTTISTRQQLALTAVSKDAQGQALAGVSVTWLSSDPGVASMDAGGVATGVAAGTTTITASTAGITSNALTLTVATSAIGAPVNTGLPSVTVTDRTSFLELSTSTGTWTNSPTSFAYGWTRNGTAIPAASSSTYSTTSTDSGSALASVVTAANAVGTATATSAAVRVPGTSPGSAGNPTLGAHALVFHISGRGSGGRFSTPALTTQASGSTMLVFVGKGSVFTLSPPADSYGNSPYTQLGGVHEYTRWAGEGTAAYAFNAMVGGANHSVSVDDSNLADEVTFAAVEVRNGGVVQDLQWNEVLNVTAQTSRSVTTTGPATLVAVWFGDAASTTPSNPVPNNGFTVIDGNGNSIESVQMFVATRDVAAAGTYNVTWNTTPLQGAQLYLAAVQKR